MSEEQLIPLKNYESLLTASTLAILNHAQAETVIFKKRSVTTSLLFLALVHKGIGFKPDFLSRIRVLITPGEELGSQEAPLSPLAGEVLTNANKLRSEMGLKKIDHTCLLIGFLALTKGKHLDLFKQLGLDREFLHDNYLRTFLVSELLSAKPQDLQNYLNKLSQYIITRDKFIDQKLDLILAQLGPKKI